MTQSNVDAGLRAAMTDENGNERDYHTRRKCLAIRKEVLNWCELHGQQYASADAAEQPCKFAVISFIGLLVIEQLFGFIVQRVLEHYFGGRNNERGQALSEL
jgi:hypothetical protein